MSTSVSATAVRHSEQTHHHAAATHAAQHKSEHDTAKTAAESKPAEHVGKKVDIKA
jgi:hypothetical protein